ncbi:MAG: TolC family protein [Deltaproteobacteria bacterium]
MKRGVFLFVLVNLVTPLPAAFPAGISPPARTVSMGECVETALRSNIDIAVSREEREIGELGVPIEEAAFLPGFTGDLGASRSFTPSGSALDGNLSLDQRILRLDLGARELLRTGTTLSLVFENQREESSTSIALLSPQYRTGITLSAAQPLLRNRGREATEAPLRIARAGAAEKTEEWKATVMDTVAAARIAFLAFSSAVREVEVRRAAVELAERLRVETEARIDAGAAPSMDRFPAESAVAARREELLRAEAAAGTAELDLKRILGFRSAREWEERLVPAPLPGEIPPPGEGETFDVAVLRRPEIAAWRARKTGAEVREAAARSRNLPSLDLTLSAGLSGLSGTPNPNPLFSGNVGAFSGNYRDSLDQMFSGRYYNWGVGLKTEFPWGLRKEKAEWARADAALREQRLLEEGLLARVRVEVQKGRLDLDSALARIAAARVAVSAAERKLDAEERKLAAGRSTTVEVLRFQQDLSEARLNEVRATADAHAAQTRLRRATGTILDKEGIVLR